MTKEWNYYVGDPCYVIDYERWSDFCDLLFKHRNYHGVGIEWSQVDSDGELHEGSVEVWNSPFGDGCWGFTNTVRGMEGWVAGKEMGVDAGLLAIVPRELIGRKEMGETTEGLGILFNSYPDLETGEHLGGYVHLNGAHPDGYYQCDCGDITDEGHMWWCDNCGSSGCGSCGGNCNCSECESCGTHYDGGYYQSKCVRCLEEE